MLLFISSIFVHIIYNKIEFIKSSGNACNTVDTLPTDKKMIVFSAGGGYWPYYLGIAKYIKENYDLTDVCIVGTSAGGLSVLALSQPVNIDDIMNESLYTCSILSKYYFGVFSLQWSRLYKQLIIIFLSGKYVQNTNSFFAVSRLTLFGLKKRYFISGVDMEAIADSAVASCWIPLLTAPFFQPFFYIGGSYYLDGFWSGKDKINKENSIIIYPWRFEKLPLYTYWLWLGRDYNIGLYNIGYEHARKYKDAFSILSKKSLEVDVLL